jgi:kynurenine formamidase
MIITPEHAGTHIDALCHQAEDMCLYGNLPVTSDIQTPAGFTQLGIDGVAPIFRRGIMIDVKTYCPEDVKPNGIISAKILQQTCSRQSLTIPEGSVVLVRTGYGAYWNEPDRYLEAPGMDGTAAEWLAGQKPFAVGSDNTAWDLPGYVDEITKSTLPGHSILLVRNGIYIVENLFLEELASQKIYEFLFVAIPLKFYGGTGSPVRPVAICI